MRWFITGVAKWWRSTNGWLKLWFFWSLGCSIASLVTINVQRRTPGAFNGPEKVAVRRSIKYVQMAGILIIGIGTLVSLRRAERSAP